MTGYFFFMPPRVPSPRPTRQITRNGLLGGRIQAHDARPEVDRPDEQELGEGNVMGVGGGEVFERQHDALVRRVVNRPPRLRPGQVAVGLGQWTLEDA
jgi:hypothetical protein